MYTLSRDCQLALAHCQPRSSHDVSWRIKVGTNAHPSPFFLFLFFFLHHHASSTFSFTTSTPTTKQSFWRHRSSTLPVLRYTFNSPLVDAGFTILALLHPHLNRHRRRRKVYPWVYTHTLTPASTFPPRERTCHEALTGSFVIYDTGATTLINIL